jgi:hypothetical protein
MWQPEVMFAADPTHNGMPTPGLAGRLYLFGPETGHPLVGDGSLVVDLFDDSPVASGGQPKLLEKWCLDKDTLKRLLRRDFLGQGYTLFLPWGTYRPDIHHVHLMVCYTPQKGSPLYAPSSPVTLSSDNVPPQLAHRTVVGAPNPVIPTGYRESPAQGVLQAAYAAQPAGRQPLGYQVAPPSAARWPANGNAPAPSADTGPTPEATTAWMRSVLAASGN